MEVFSLLLVVIFAISLAYCRLLVWLGARTATVPDVLRRISLAVLALFALELLLLLVLGVRSTGRLLGPLGFYVAHRIGFFIIPMALANVLILRKRRTAFVRWYIVPFLCAPVGVSIFFLGFIVNPHGS
jgi:hypothetical protein